MTYLRLVSGWTLILSFLSVAVIQSLHFKADPTDDFSFLVADAQAAESYSLMSAESVEAILADHLDLFPQSQIPKLSRHLLKLCRVYRFDPAFVLSLVQVESAFRAKVVSPAGAIGLMQLMPATAQIIANRFKIHYTGAKSLTDPFTNLAVGVAYLSVLREKYRGFSPYFAIAAYNIGPGRLDELLSQKSFRPVATKAYYEKIRLGVPKLRFYRKRSSNVQQVRRESAKSSSQA